MTQGITMASRVHRSDDGILYLTGGSNDVLSLFSADGFAQAVDVAAWQARLAARDALFARLGVPWRMLLAPEKLSVLGMHTARALLGPEAAAPAARLIAAVPHPMLVDPAPYLREQHAAGYSVYTATDSHWTSVGAFCALQWLMAQMGIPLDYAPFLACTRIVLRYHGDLWEPEHAELPPDRFERLGVPAGMVRIHANALVRFREEIGRDNDMRLHTGCHVVYRNEAAQHPGRVVLFGSSFSDHRAACSLLTHATALFFREVHFIWSTSLDPGYLERIGPDVVLIEMPERFLPLCPADDLDIDAYAQTRITAWQALGRATPAPT